MKPTAYEGNEKYIFVSYAHRDRDEVYKVLNELERSGYRFWYDEGVAPGSEWPEDIADHLSRSALLLAFISPNAVASSNVRREINYALSKEKPFLSIVLEPTEMSPGMEMQLSSRQSIIKYMYSSWESFMRKLYLCSELEVCRTPAVNANSVLQTAPAAPGKTADSTDRVSGGRLLLILALAAVICAVVIAFSRNLTKDTEESDAPPQETNYVEPASTAGWIAYENQGVKYMIPDYWGAEEPGSTYLDEAYIAGLDAAGGEYAFRYTCQNDNYTEQLEFGRDDWFDPENYSAAYEKGAKQCVSDLLEVYREWYGEDCIFGTGSIDISGTECWWIDYRTTADDDGQWFRYYELYIPVDSRGQNDKFLYSFDGSDTENIGHYLSVRQALINSIIITE